MAKPRAKLARPDRIRRHRGRWHGHLWAHPHYRRTHLFWTLPCRHEIVIVNGISFYRCSHRWYRQINHEGEVVFVVSSVPHGVEVVVLPDDHLVVDVAGDTDYYHHHTFYHRVVRNKRAVLVVVDPPVGAELHVESPPDGAVEVDVDGVAYYQFDTVFYQQTAGGYVVVEGP